MDEQERRGIEGRKVGEGGGRGQVRRKNNESKEKVRQARRGGRERGEEGRKRVLVLREKREKKGL